MIKTVYSAYCQKEIQIDYSTLMKTMAREMIASDFRKNEEHLDTVETYLGAYLIKLGPKPYGNDLAQYARKILNEEQFNAVINELATLYPTYLKRFKQKYVGSIIELINHYPHTPIYAYRPARPNDKWYYDDFTHYIKLYEER